MIDSGIYALYWWEPDLVYVGLSQNLKDRRAQHMRKLERNKHSNYKVQQAFNSYRHPEFIVLEKCLIPELPHKEQVWCVELDALGPKGLCLVEPGIVGFGTNSNSSKYSKPTILKVFSLLYKCTLSFNEISTRLRVPKSLVSDISCGKAHVWLRDTYPTKYRLLGMLRANTYAKIYSTPKAEVISPTGEILTIYCVAEFCREHFNNTNDKKHMSSVLTGNRKSHKGYRLFRNLSKDTNV